MHRSARPFAILLLSIVAACAGTPEGDGGDAARSTGPDIRTEEVSYESGGTKLTGYIAWDASRGEGRPGILVVHEWWGHGEYARSRAEQLAALGYTAMALDMYGDGKKAEHPEDAQKFMMEVFADMEAGTARFVAAKRVLEEHPSTDPGKVSAIGYCFGGAIVLGMARSGLDLDLVASFHGSLGTQTPAKPGAVQARVLVCHGEADPLVKPEEVEGFKKEMADAKVDLTFIGFPGAKHAFTNPGATARGEKFGLPLAYDAKADAESWAALEKMLAEVYGE